MKNVPRRWILGTFCFAALTGDRSDDAADETSDERTEGIYIVMLFDDDYFGGRRRRRFDADDRRGRGRRRRGRDADNRRWPRRRRGFNGLDVAGGRGLVGDFATRLLVRAGGGLLRLLVLRRGLGGRFCLLLGFGRGLSLLLRSGLGRSPHLLLLFGRRWRLASALGGSGHSRSAKRDTRESGNHHLLDHLVHITPSLSVLNCCAHLALTP